MITFKELSLFYTFVIVYYLLDSLLILVLYFTQDSITSHQVFLIYHSSCIFFDCLCVIILPIHILINTLSELPEIWTNFTPIKYKFYMTGIVVSPRRDPEGSSRAGADFGGVVGVVGGARGGVDRFKFISTGNQRPDHTKIQMENLQLPDVVD